MDYTFNFDWSRATHTPTGAMICIDRSQDSGDFVFSLENGSDSKVDRNDIGNLFRNLRKVIEDELVRRKFRKLYDHDFGQDIESVEFALSKHPNRKATQRTIQSWLAEPERPSSRTCPAWAVEALHDHLNSHPGMRASVLARENRYDPRYRKSVGEVFRDLESTSINKQAEACLIREKNERDRLTSLSMTEFPAAMARELNELRRELAGMQQTMNCLTDAFRSVDDDATVQDIKKAYDANALLCGLYSHNLFETMRDIHASCAEFASDDGTLAKVDSPDAMSTTE